MPPEQVAQLNPFVRSDDVLGALHVPEAYRVNPADVAQAVSKAARNRGVGVFEKHARHGHRDPARGTHAASRRRADGPGPDRLRDRGAGRRRVGRARSAAWPAFPCRCTRWSTAISSPTQSTASTTVCPISRDPDAYIYSREEVGGFLIGFLRAGRQAPLQGATAGRLLVRQPAGGLGSSRTPRHQCHQPLPGIGKPPVSSCCSPDPRASRPTAPFSWARRPT